jgi:hypothetical protein
MGRSRKAHAGLQNVGDVRDLAGSAVETVRDHATAAGESVGSAVTSALDAVAARGRRARKKAQKKARKQSRSVRSTAQSSVDGARRQSARQLRKAAVKAADQLEKRAAQLDQPKHRRGRVLKAGVALAALGVVAAKSLGGKDPAPDQPTEPEH